MIKVVKKLISTYVPEGYSALVKVKIISEEDMEVDRVWYELKESYKSIESNPNADWMHYMLNSLINSIIYQRRGVFVLGRDSFREEILSKDKNWQKKHGFKNEKWPVFIDYLKKEGFLVQLSENEKGLSNVYEVVDKEILSHLSYDREKQVSESFAFRNKTKELSTGDEKGDGCLATSGDGEDRRKNIEQRNLECSEKISFQQLLFKQITDGLPRFDEIPYLAQLAVENCEDFECDNYTVSTLKKHLQNMCKSKVSPKQKEYIAKIVSNFEFEASKYANLTQVQGRELKQPEALNNTPLVSNVDEEEAMQSHTKTVLLNSFGVEKIKMLKKRIDRADDVDRPALEAELNYWENLV